MRRVSAALAVALLWSAGVWAQGEEAAPDEEFVPWTGEATAPPAQTAPARPPDARKNAAAPAPQEEKKEGSEAAQSEAPLDTQWNTLPGDPAASPPPPDAPVVSAPPIVVDPSAPRAPDASAAQQVVRRPSPRDFNRVSLYGGLTLGQWNRAAGFYLGFPLVGFKAGIGLLDRLDMGVGFDSFYGVMNEPRAFAKFRFYGDARWNVAAQLEGGMAFFTQNPQSDPKGARWLTGRRNYNIETGLVASYQGESVQSARLFLDTRYHLGLDTQSYPKDPLGGVPPAILPGHNINVRLGAEMPFSPSTSFLFIFGFDLHGRAEDAPFMPVVSVGLVTGV